MPNPPKAVQWLKLSRGMAICLGYGIKVQGDAQKCRKATLVEDSESK